MKNTRNRGGWRQDMIDNLEVEYRVPEDWQKGPVQNRYRHTTDKICLVIFMLYLLTMIVTMIYALAKSSHDDLSKIYDSSGNPCGFDSVKDYPLLYLQTFSKPYKSICVKTCPVFDYNEIKYKTAGGVDKAEDYPGELYFSKFSSNFSGASHTKNPDMSYEEAFSYNEGFVNNYFTETQWENYLKKYKMECLPNKQFADCKYLKGKFYIYDSYPLLNTVCVPLSPKPALLFNRVSSKFDHGLIGDMTDAVGLFGWCTLIALGLSLVFLLLICLCTSLITWVMVVALAAVFISFGIFVILNIFYTGPLNSALNAVRVKYLAFMMEYKYYLLTLAIVSILIGLVVFYLIWKFRKYISTSIPIFSLASKTSLKNILLIILSVVVIAVQIGVFFLELYILLRIYTSGKEIHDPENGNPFVSYEMPVHSKIFVVIHFFGMYWIIVTLNNFNDFVCSAVTVNHYFKTNIANIRIFCHSLGHNIGSIAWSIVLLPTLLIKLVFGLFDYLLTSDNPNGCQRFLNKIFCPCCWCYEKFIDRFSENYFPITYMGSENFFKATTRFYYLSEKYADETSTIMLMGGLFGIFGKLLIAFTTGYLGFVIYNHSIHLQQNIDYIGSMLLICFLIGFLIGSLFINLYSTTYDTIMVCYLLEKNIEEVHNHPVENCPTEIREVLDRLRDNPYQKL
jgi:hypothetical protein